MNRLQATRNLVSRVVSSLAVCCEGFEYLVGGLGPDEGLGDGVLFVAPLAYVGFKLDHAVVSGAAEPHPRAVASLLGQYQDRT